MLVALNCSKKNASEIVEKAVFVVVWWGVKGEEEVQKKFRRSSEDQKAFSQKRLWY